MNWILRVGVVMGIQSVPLCVLAQSTFQKLLPDLSPGWGNTYCRSASGDLTFAAGVADQFDSLVGDIALLSFNEQGDTLWTRVYGRPHNDNCFHLLATSDGGYLLTGSTTGTGNSAVDIFLIKTNATGDTIWTRAYGQLTYNTGFGAIECSDGGFIVVGSAEDSGGYYGGLYIIKINAQGDPIWTRFYDHLIMPDLESSVSVDCAALASNGDFFVAGNRASYPGVFLARLDSTGYLIWCRTTDDSPYFDQLEATPDGGVILSGDFNSNPLLIQLDPLGNTVWSKAYDGVAYWGVVSFTRTWDNGLAVTGQTVFQGAGSGNVYFLKTDSAGEVLLSRTYGDTAWDAGRGIVQSADGGYYLVAFRFSSQDPAGVSVTKTDPSGNSDCYQHYDTTVAVNVQLNWYDLELQSFSSIAERHPSACSIRSGTTVLPLCPVGMNDSRVDDPPIHVFPNPTHGRFTVVIASDYAGSEVRIFNAIGERVYSERVVQPESRIDLTSFPRGMYLVKVSTGRSAVVEKVVLE